MISNKGVVMWVGFEQAGWRKKKKLFMIENSMEMLSRKKVLLSHPCKDFNLLFFQALHLPS